MLEACVSLHGRRTVILRFGRPKEIDVMYDNSHLGQFCIHPTRRHWPRYAWSPLEYE